MYVRMYVCNCPTPQWHSRLVGNYQFLTSNFNFKTTPISSKFPISINFTNPLRTTIYVQIYQNSPKIYKTTQTIDMWDEQRDS